MAPHHSRRSKVSCGGFSAYLGPSRLNAGQNHSPRNHRATGPGPFKRQATFSVLPGQLKMGLSAQSPGSRRSQTWQQRQRSCCPPCQSAAPNPCTRRHRTPTIPVHQINSWEVQGSGAHKPIEPPGPTVRVATQNQKKRLYIKAEDETG